MEPPLATTNTVLSILDVDYHGDKVACYVSDDDSAAMLTFETLFETLELCKEWGPILQEIQIEPLSVGVRVRGVQGLCWLQKHNKHSFPSGSSFRDTQRKYPFMLAPDACNFLPQLFAWQSGAVVAVVFFLEEDP
ncbi:uncharacterized protein LOC143878854 isoform X2 [Tasmannia lanceolata]